MPTPSVLVAPFEGAYIGNYGSLSKMTQIHAIRTEGAKIEEAWPTEYNTATKTAEGVGNHIIKVTLTFLYDDDMATRLSRGLSITASINDHPSNQEYLLFLVHPNYTGKHSYWFPKIRTVQSYEKNYEKGRPTQLAVEFIAEDRDPDVVLHLKDTVAALQAVIGAPRAPF